MTKTSKVLRHESCPKCGSKDNLAVYTDHKYCFTPDCGYYEPTGGGGVIPQATRVRPREMTGEIKAIPDRGISYDTCKKFGVTTSGDKRYYPNSDTDGSKVRVVSSKDFYRTGEQPKELFGQKLFPSGGKYLTITEGEEDCLAVSEMFNNKWPVVSLTNGSSGAVQDIKNNLEYIESFDKVVLSFDNDDAGLKALDKVLPIFSHNKVKVCKLPLKDASDMLVNHRVTEFMNCWWSAESYRPTGIVSFSSETMWDSFVNRKTVGVTPLPASFGTLNAMMNGGIANGEVTVIGALTSIGKTTMVYNLLYDMALQSQKKIGAIFLEADQGEITEKLCSLHMEKNLSVEENLDFSAIRKIYDDLKTKVPLEIYDHHGSSDIDDLFSKMRFMIKGLDCDVLILDPLQAAVQSNENAMIDKFMDSVLKLSKETGASIVVVSHMNKPSTADPHAITEYNTKGSGSINQIAFNTILLSRDKMSEDEYERNLTKVQLVKCRRTGKTGTAGWLYYNGDTGRLEQGEPPQVRQANLIEDF